MINLSTLYLLGRVEKESLGRWCYIPKNNIERALKIIRTAKIKPIFHAIKEKADSEEDYDNGKSNEYKMFFCEREIEVDIDEEEE